MTELGLRRYEEALDQLATYGINLYCLLLIAVLFTLAIIIILEKVSRNQDSHQDTDIEKGDKEALIEDVNNTENI